MYVRDNCCQHLLLGKQRIDMQTLDGIPLDDLHDGLWEKKLPDIAKPAAYLWADDPSPPRSLS